MVRAVPTLEMLRGKRTAILEVAHRHHARNLSVFGSVATGEAGLDSDVDFLADFEPGSTLLDHVGLIQDLTDLLGMKVDVVSRGGLLPRDASIVAGGVEL